MLDRAGRGEPQPDGNPPIGAWLEQAGEDPLQAGHCPPQWLRWATHLTLVGLAVAAIAAGHLTSLPLPGRVTGALVAAGPAMAPAAPLVRQASARGGGDGYLVRAAVPVTTIADGAETIAAGPAAAPGEQGEATPTPAAAPLTVRTYAVQPGDTVIALARRFGITPETILSSNPTLAGNPDLLQLGQELQILPVSGVLHEVQAGESLSSIAAEYKVGLDAIVGYQENKLVEPYVLHPGQKLVVPGAVWSYTPSFALASAASAASRVRATGTFMWPTTGGITQGWWASHPAIDLGTAKGTPIIASDAGVVVEAGWSDVGYGQYVMLDHGNGFKTRYAHMSVIIAKLGQQVKKGQRIGLVGSTGNSTGPHLHFEIYKQGVPRNPFNYLP